MVGQPADDDGRDHKSSEVAITGCARGRREHRQTQHAFGDVGQHRGHPQAGAERRPGEQNRKGLPGDGYRRERQWDGDMGHEGGKQAEGEDQARIADQRSLRYPVPNQRG